jgi:hypothetical protein
MHLKLAPHGGIMTRKLIALWLVGATLSVLLAQSQDLNALAERVRELNAQNSEVKVTLLDGSTLRGQILRAEADSFTIRQKKTAQEIALQYAQVKEVKKVGSLRTKAILIPAAIVGAALLVMCVAPYPIGFLCREDPS